VKDHSTENFLKQVKQTDALLGEYLDLYQIHSATFDSGILTDTGAYQALADCRRERGWAIGLSVSGPEQDEILRTAMKIKDTNGDPLFDTVQCTYNLFEQRPAPALAEALDSGMVIIIKEGMANGRILRSETVRKYADRLSCRPDQLALAFILAQEFAPRVLSGAVTAEQLISNWEAHQVADKLRSDRGLLKEIADGCVVKSEDYWDERAALSWN